MEIKEIVSYYINDTTQTLDVTFRLINDCDDEIRTDQIELSEVKIFGYDFNTNNSSEYDEYYDEMLDEDFDYDDYESNEVTESEIISFLNEYYLINPDNLPKTELF